MDGETDYLSQISIRGLFMLAGIGALVGAIGLFLVSGSNPIDRQRVFLAQNGTSLLIMSIYFLLSAATAWLWRRVRAFHD